MPYDSPYTDPALYDVIYSKVQDDIPFYVGLATAARGPTLEVGCGTGRTLLPALDAGADLDGLELDGGMLAHLEAKARARGHAPRLMLADMRDFTMPRRYALATAPFRAFMHMITLDDQLRALRCVREHLEPGGCFALDLFYPNLDTIVSHHGRRVLSIEVIHPETGRRVEVYDVSRYDRVRQIVTVEREILQHDTSGSVMTTHAGFHLRWTYLYEMELLLHTAGFSRWEIAGGFDRRPLEKDTDGMVVRAWKD